MEDLMDLLARHGSDGTVNYQDGELCVRCGFSWPCEAARARDLLAAAESQHKDVIHWDCQDAGCRAANDRRQREDIAAYIEALPVAEFMALESVMAHQAQVRGLDTTPLEPYVPRSAHPSGPCGNSDCERCYPLTAVFWKKQL